MSFLNVGNVPEEIIVEEKELENDLPTPELEDENSPEIAPKPFHEKNVGCGTQRFQMTKTRLKLNLKTREIDWLYIWPQHFDTF